MAEIRVAEQDHAVAGTRDFSNPAYQAYRVLHIGFIIAPIVAGLDKFLELLAEWTRYLWPGVPEITGLAPETFMGIVGGIEVIAGLIVAFRPKIGGYVVSAWLVGIIINLLLLGDYYDIALRDFGLALGALALARLATAFQRS